MLYGCQQILLNPDNNLKAILEFLCGEATKLSNCGTYYARQLYFKTGKIPSKFYLNNELADNIHFAAMYSQAAQQCLMSVAESFKSFVGLLKGIKNGTVTQKPKLPGYRNGGLSLVTYPAQAIKPKPQGLRFPLGSKIKTWFGLAEFYLPMPSNLDHKQIREYRILPRNGEFYLELVYKLSTIQSDVDFNKAIGIDPGLNNWLTCVSNVGTSLIVDGLQLKSLNQWYNKRVSVLKENQPQGFWSKQLALITEKRNRQVRDAVNKAARLILNHCLENKIGTIVFGWNEGQRQNINLGSKTNQKFVQIPTARLKDRIAQLCQQYGLRFEETEESYTSKASFLDSDLLPTFGAKLEGWQESGKRVKRGLYQLANGTKINADCNGAANILRKVAVKLGLDLSRISSGDLIAPLRIRFWIS
ncbi:transposase [Nostoc sp. UHCC 0252]|uniref:RNA-guided endonuclease InsQ/TnpB family protein n=1 Tax=Nostoc sp. UHCC 0252 TaxID=3110241 RepID=UPI002B21C867|nr:transposase [Nostoc sp. UHCC 0252]MEA5604136.1 transposase [Nostoc sp. UHCC 0252]